MKLQSEDQMEKINQNLYWEAKPPWCQPWSIILFGISLIISLLYIGLNKILLVLVSIIVITWWILFLFIAPFLYSQENN